MNNTWINGEQYILISTETLFQWWDWLDALENEPEQAFYLFTQFLEACEDELEIHPEFVKKIESMTEEDFVPLDNYDDLFDDENPLDIPFNPRHDF